MYAIIREGDGRFYTSMVFGYYKSSNDSDYKNRFWIILNNMNNLTLSIYISIPYSTKVFKYADSIGLLPWGCV